MFFNVKCLSAVYKKGSEKVNITPCYGYVHLGHRSTLIKFIAIHYTAGVTSDNHYAQSTARQFAVSSVEASADFIVDDEEIVQYNPNLEKYFCWAVGGPLEGTTTSLARSLYGTATNNNTISIEICSRKRNHNTLYASDKDWYFTEESLNNAIELVKYLMDIYNIDIDHVIMHHHVTGKLCPAMWCHNENELQGWYDFKKKLNGDELDMTQEELMSVVGTGDTHSSWATPAIEYMKENGIVKGDGKGNYGWEKPITREAFVTILYAFAKKMGCI